jgi:hypothetical protein
VLRRTALAGALACIAVAAPNALADSIVYEKDGNIWVAFPDGSGQRQVTTSAGYGTPSQADDGTIIAAKDDVLHRLSRSGRLLNTAGDDDYGTKIFTGLTPDGALASYGFFANGPILTGPYIGVSHSDRPTEKEEIDGPLEGYLNPSWLNNNTLLLYPQSLIVDVQLWTVSGDVQDWFTDPAVDLGGGEVNRQMTAFAATADAGSSIRLYRLDAPPPAPPVFRCVVSGGLGVISHPTWSPDGTRLAFHQDHGIYVIPVNLNACVGQSELVIPRGKAPDWGPARAGAALVATAPKRMKLAALLRGISVKVTCSCTARATLLLAGKAIGRAKKTLSGSAKMKVKPSRAGRARLMRGGKSITVRISGAGKTVTRRVNVLR